MLITAAERFIQFKKIAVLTDLESDSERLLSYGASLARWYGATLILAHACMDSHAHEGQEGVPTSTANETAEEQLRSVAARLAMEDLVTKTLVCTSNVTRLLQELDETLPDLLLLGTHGRAGIEKRIVGSVAEGVFRRVQCPVLVVGPAAAHAQPARQMQFDRVLYATDLSAASVAALQYAAGIAHDHEAQLIALHVESGTRNDFSFDRLMSVQRLEDWMNGRIDGMAAALAGVRCQVDFGRPEEKIIDTAVNWNADILVIGARGLGAMAGLASHFFGGTAYGVVSNARCPVLIVPQP